MGTGQPLYQEIVNDIKLLIANGKVKEHDRLPTEMELAAQYRVSRITVSRATKELESQHLIYKVKGKGTFVAPSGQAGGRGGALHLISLIHPVRLNFVYDILCGAESELKRHGYYISYHCTNQDPEEEKAVMMRLLDDNVSGLLINPCTCVDNLDLYSTLVINHTPFVLLDKSLDMMDTTAVMADNFNGMYRLVEHMLERGHRHIAFISHQQGVQSAVQDRYRGYCRALVEHGIPLNQAYIVDDSLTPVPNEDGNSREERYDWMLDAMLERLLTLPEPPTVLAAVNDALAARLCYAVRRRGLSIPDDISLTGFDNLDFTDTLVPGGLTTVEQPFTRLGAKAAQLLISQINTHNFTPKKVALESPLIVRNSVKDLR